MPVKIRLRREGKKKQPYYSLIICDSRSPRDGKFIEKLGFYDPISYRNEKVLSINIDRTKYWISKGAIPSKIVNKILSNINILPKYPYMKKINKEIIDDK